jgi:hypothetical protein
MTCELETLLQAYDGKSISILSEARAACRSDPGYLKELINLCSDNHPEISEGATWILKAETEEGLRFGADLLEGLMRNLPALATWPAQLHILQAIDAFDLTEPQAQATYAWATSLADHSRPFLRAWSLHARVIIALRFQQFLPDAKSALCAAANDKAASVRARARKLEALLAKHADR